MPHASALARTLLYVVWFCHGAFRRFTVQRFLKILKNDCCIYLSFLFYAKRRQVRLLNEGRFFSRYRMKVTDQPAAADVGFYSPRERLMVSQDERARLSQRSRSLA
jgi:hypothetical protein